MGKAIAYCKDTCDKRSGCTGFFFQTHGNGHEICGFYTGSVNTGAPSPATALSAPSKRGPFSFYVCFCDVNLRVSTHEADRHTTLDLGRCDTREIVHSAYT